MSMLVSTFRALSISAMPPQAHGEDMDVPFISMRRCRVHWGTGAIAAPGALRHTPISPSAVGPLLDLKLVMIKKICWFDCHVRQRQVVDDVTTCNISINLVKRNLINLLFDLPGVLESFKRWFNYWMSRYSHIRRHICPNAYDAWRSSSRSTYCVQWRTCITSTAYKDDTMLVNHLQSRTAKTFMQLLLLGSSTN